MATLRFKTAAQLTTAMSVILDHVISFHEDFDSLDFDELANDFKEAGPMPADSSALIRAMNECTLGNIKPKEFVNAIRTLYLHVNPKEHEGEDCVNEEV